MAIFHFRLREIDDVEPWVHGSTRRLHWFGLTDGYSWLRLGDVDVGALRPEIAPDPAWPYLDYQVARVWEDVLEAAAHAFTPVPSDASARVAPDPVAFAEWLERRYREIDGAGGEDRWDLLEGFEVWRVREVAPSDALGGVDLSISSTDDEVTLSYRTRDPVRVEARGFVRLRREDFIAELRRFDRALMNAMRERVRLLVERGGLAGVEIDLDQLVRDQADREQWLDRALARAEIRVESWDAFRRIGG
ncbi:MAG: hypothetical protein J0L92_26745 [Deltaproteobacteria bacterium]|nr:hypothetical protein [Deltaproteobacteria bacterium]